VHGQGREYLDVVGKHPHSAFRGLFDERERIDQNIVERRSVLYLLAQLRRVLLENVVGLGREFLSSGGDFVDLTFVAGCRQFDRPAAEASQEYQDLSKDAANGDARVSSLFGENRIRRIFRACLVPVTACG
jgi:hypothetical protein